MIDLPNITKDSLWEDIPARHWQNLVEAVRASADLQGGAGLAVRKHGGQMGIDALDFEEARPAPILQVVILDAKWETTFPGTETKLRRLKVRAIKYRSLPPVPDEYAWASEPFEAFPVAGLDFEVFAPAVYQPPPPPPPPQGDDPQAPPLDLLGPVGAVQAFRADYAGQYWFVQTTQGAKRTVIIRGFSDPASRWLQVQEVTQDFPTEGTWDGSYVTVGAVFDAQCWGNTQAGNYDIDNWIWKADQPDPALSTIMPLDRIGGIWTITQQPKWEVIDEDGPVRMLDCTKARPEENGA